MWLPARGFPFILGLMKGLGPEGRRDTEGGGWRRMRGGGVLKMRCNGRGGVGGKGQTEAMMSFKINSFTAEVFASLHFPLE